MEYVYKEIRASQKSNSLAEYAQELEKCCINNMQCLNELKNFTENYGLDEAEHYLENGLREMEKSAMWLRAAASCLKNV